MDARFGVTPERPYRLQTFEEGQDAPGVVRVIPSLARSSGIRSRNTSQPACPPYPQHRAQGPRWRSLWATAAGAEFQPCPNRPASPTHTPQPSGTGPTPRSPSLMDASNSHISPSHRNAANETPRAAPVSPRARHPWRARAPGPAHPETPIPTELNQPRRSSND